MNKSSVSREQTSYCLGREHEKQPSFSSSVVIYLSGQKHKSSKKTVVTIIVKDFQKVHKP